MLIFPKFLGLMIYLLQNRDKKKIGGRWGALKSVLTEIVFSALMAPIMMMFQSKFVFDIFAGRDAGWKTQNRDDCATSFRLALERHFWHMTLGILTMVVVYFYAPELFWWMLPITIGLTLSVPISMLTSLESAGRWCRSHNFFVIPEEVDEPAIIVSARKYYAKLSQKKEEVYGVTLVVRDSIMNALHLMMLPVNGPAPEFAKKVLDSAQIKLENYINHGLEPDLSKEEETALLCSPEILKKAHLALRLAA